MTSDLRERVQSVVGAAFTLEHELGGGAMSRVYVATDVALDRRIVIKVLPPELAAGVSTDRFRREVQLAARLQHPHIVSALATWEGAGVLCYSMPYIEGESLRAKLVRDGALPIPEVVRLLRDVIEALEYAHRMNVIHRDIKPENILIAEGHALVADFGIARALSDSAVRSELTSAGVALGTPAYMAPEQVAAAPGIDHRADIYSVGAMAYEMLTGRPPFINTTPSQVLAAQVYQTPEPILKLRPSVPAPLASLVMRCLEKHPADRPRNAAEMLRELDIVATPGSGSVVVQSTAAGWRAIRRRSFRVAAGTVLAIGVLSAAGVTIWRVVGDDGYAGSVAVMPFKQSGHPEVGILANALVEQINDELTKVEALKVISRTSVDALARGPALTLPQIAETLHVRHVVEGVVREVGTDSVRVTVQLVDSRRDVNLWSETFLRPRNDLTSVPEEIGRQVTAMLVAALGVTRTDAAARSRDHVAAVSAYLEGKAAMGPRTPGALARAIAKFEEAIALDSSYAQAHAQLASTLALSLTYRYARSESPYSTMGRALAHGDRAVSLNPNATEGYISRGFALLVAQAPFDIVQRDFEKARELRPNAPDLPAWRATLLARQGREQEALRDARRAIELDPLAPSRRISYAWDALRARRYDEAQREALKAAQLQHDLLLPRALAARAMLLSGDAEGCRRMDLGPYIGTRAACLSALGRRPEAERLVDSLRRAAADSVVAGGGRVFEAALAAQDLAHYYAWVGDLEQTLHWLAAAFERSPVGVDVRTITSGWFDRVLDERLRQALDKHQRAAWKRASEAKRQADRSETPAVAA